MHVTVKEIREGSYTTDKQVSDKTNPFVFYFYRPLAYYFTKVFLLFDCSPTFVTVLSLIPLLVGIPLISFSTNILGRVIGGGMFVLWIVLDCVDGTIARLTKSTSQYGDLIDATVGYVALWGFPLAVGMAAYSDRLNSRISLGESYVICVYMGGIQAVLSIFPRLVMHKKYQRSDPKDNSFQNRGKYSKIASWGMFILDCQGMPILIYFISVFLHTLNIMVYMYMCIYLLYLVAVMIKLLKKEQE